ncbi:uncharacterized protein LOC142347944 [Convolutriloba macropyga]|uniref:uncharacterized protein LOC142347944 n=1 Tax=Convolutriloba macropyga TaxID=536237 RepID=UPI003F5260E4
MESSNIAENNESTITVAETSLQGPSSESVVVNNAIDAADKTAANPTDKEEENEAENVPRDSRYHRWFLFTMQCVQLIAICVIALSFLFMLPTYSNMRKHGEGKRAEGLPAKQLQMRMEYRSQCFKSFDALYLCDIYRSNMKFEMGRCVRKTKPVYNLQQLALNCKPMYGFYPESKEDIGWAARYIYYKIWSLTLPFKFLVDFHLQSSSAGVYISPDKRLLLETSNPMWRERSLILSLHNQ